MNRARTSHYSSKLHIGLLHPYPQLNIKSQLQPVNTNSRLQDFSIQLLCCQTLHGWRKGTIIMPTMRIVQPYPPHSTIEVFYAQLFTIFLDFILIFFPLVNQILMFTFVRKLYHPSITSLNECWVTHFLLTCVMMWNFNFRNLSPPFFYQRIISLCLFC